MGGDIWPEGRRILAAIKAREESGSPEVPSDELASDIGVAPDEMLRHLDHLVKGGYVECHSELGSKKCRAVLTELGRASA